MTKKTVEIPVELLERIKDALKKASELADMVCDHTDLGMDPVGQPQRWGRGGDLWRGSCELITQVECRSEALLEEIEHLPRV